MIDSSSLSVKEDVVIFTRSMMLKIYRLRAFERGSFNSFGIAIIKNRVLSVVSITYPRHRPSKSKTIFGIIASLSSTIRMKKSVRTITLFLLFEKRQRG
mmetsp:Transcript_7389/g.15840  ORF Transcript_7389/g.15840 Transcript_7389/m.15840 type:complete len:99 (+) Transcript_7389:1805-2101(+)